MAPYFTIVIPYIPAPHRTPWHPTTPIGPFATLQRGAFATIDDAIVWARFALNGTPYSIRQVD